MKPAREFGDEDRRPAHAAVMLIGDSIEPRLGPLADGRDCETYRMPTERRRILFNHTELREALDTYLRKGGPLLPPGTIVGVSMPSPDADRLQLSIHNAADGTASSIELEVGQAAVALLRYCFAKKIPLPRNAKKSLEAKGDGLALVIRIDDKNAGIKPASRDPGEGQAGEG